MTLQERTRARRTIRFTARKAGVPALVARMEMQAAIDEAWENSNNGTTAAWQMYFPDGRKPTVEEFIAKLGQKLKPTSSKSY